MIYWLKAGDTGAVKVGYAARDVAARVRLLQTGCPWPLILLRTEPGGRAVEAGLHRHYREKRIRAEWFLLSNEDVAVDLKSVAARPHVEVTRREAPKPALTDDPGMAAIRSQRGLMTKIAEFAGITHSSVVLWKRVPPRRVGLVSHVTGIPACELRPDLFGPHERATINLPDAAA